MIPIITLLIIITLSLIVTRIASIALTFTGLSRDAARFQSRSAFSGSGFTTSESELVVGHPVRRRIIMLLMLLGNAGIITIIATLLASFVRLDQESMLAEIPVRVVPADGAQPVGDYVLEIGRRAESDPRPDGWKGLILGTTPTQQFVIRLFALALGISVLWMIASSQWVDDRMWRITTAALRRWTSLEAHDYSGLLHLSEGYKVTEFVIDDGSWLAGKSLEEARLSSEGVQVLGILRPDGTYIGTPTADTYMRTRDRLVVHGRASCLVELERRRAGKAGDAAHRQSVEEEGLRLDECQDTGEVRQRTD